MNFPITDASISRAGRREWTGLAAFAHTAGLLIFARALMGIAGVRNIKALAEIAGITGEVTNKGTRHKGMTLMSRVSLKFLVLKKITGQKMKDVAGVYINSD
jgi:hypothetical protein